MPLTPCNPGPYIGHSAIVTGIMGCQHNTSVNSAPFRHYCDINLMLNGPRSLTLSLSNYQGIQPLTEILSNVRLESECCPYTQIESHLAEISQKKVLELG